MLRKLNFTSYAIFILFFVLTLIPVSLVSADEHAAFVRCQQMPAHPTEQLQIAETSEELFQGRCKKIRG